MHCAISSRMASPWTTRASVTTNERSEKSSIFASSEEGKAMGETKVLNAEEDHKKSDEGEGD
jgi:hypothetical protein